MIRVAVYRTDNIYVAINGPIREIQDKGYLVVVCNKNVSIAAMNTKTYKKVNWQNYVVQKGNVYIIPKVDHYIYR